MIHRLSIATALAILLAVAGTVDANKAPPPRPKTAITRLEIREDRTTTKHRLIIPKKLLNSAKTVASLDGQPQDGNRLRTVFAGVALSLASFSMVFVVIRRKSTAAKAVAGLLVAAAAMLFAIRPAAADIAPPQSSIVRTWQLVGQKDVEIEISEKGDKAVLVLGTYRPRILPPGRPPHKTE